MAERAIASDDQAPSAAAEEARVDLLPQKDPEGAGDGTQDGVDGFINKEVSDPLFPYGETLVLLERGFPGIGKNLADGYPALDHGSQFSFSGLRWRPTISRILAYVPISRISFCVSRIRNTPSISVTIRKWFRESHNPVFSGLVWSWISSAERSKTVQGIFQVIVHWGEVSREADVPCPEPFPGSVGGSPSGRVSPTNS